MLIWIAAARPAPEDLFSDLLPVIAGLLGLAVVGGIIIYIVRRLLRGSEDHSEAGGFTLHDLRRMREAGELSEEEFDRARLAMIDRVRNRAPADADAAPNADQTDAASAGTDQHPAEESDASPRDDDEDRPNVRRNADPDDDQPSGSGKPGG